MNKDVHYKHLGLIDYKKSWDYQEGLFYKKVNQKIENRKLKDKGKSVKKN